MLLVIIAVVIVALIIVLFRSCSDEYRLNKLETIDMPDWITVQLLDSNGASTNGTKLEEINGIVVHYVANPGSTAQGNWSYFNKTDTKTSTHFIIGLEGEIIQCVPIYEMSAASNSRNADTISIEVCHPDSTGEFNDKTMGALIKLTAWLSDLCNFKEEDIIRHYDVTGKLCPKYYVEHPKEWDAFRGNVMEAM